MPEPVPVVSARLFPSGHGRLDSGCLMSVRRVMDERAAILVGFGHHQEQLLGDIVDPQVSECPCPAL